MEQTLNGAAARVADRLTRHQIGIYLAAIALAAVIGLSVPAADGLAVAITPVLGLLLYATFLTVPFAALGAALRDLRFLAVLLILNFVLVPPVAWGLSRFVAHDRPLLVGVLLVLLVPCIDYVIVFSGLAGGAAERLLAAAPLLMLCQAILLPVYLLLMVGPEIADVVEPAPFAEALLLLIVLPLGAAATTQWVAARNGPGRSPAPQPARRAGLRLLRLADTGMVPLMALTLLVVVASQIHAVRADLDRIAAVLPLFVAFGVVMIPLGMLAARISGLEPRPGRALVFSGLTRNSLVVLPLALALPSGYETVPLVVVSQTLVELVWMVVAVRTVPRLLPLPAPNGP